MRKNVSQETRSDEAMIDSMVGGATAQLTVIADELRLLTTKVMDDSRERKVSSEWKQVAMVVDRLCFCIFSIFFIIATVVVFKRQLF